MACYAPAKWLRALFVCGLVLSVSVTPVAAQAKAGQIIISPAFQEITLTEGQATASGSLELQNQSQSDQQFTLQAIEIQQFDAEGNVSFKDKPLDTQNLSRASFITLDETVVTLPAGQTSKVDFIVANPISLSPGGHYAALIAQIQTTESRNQVLSALSAFILIRKVGGEHFNLSLMATSLPHQLWWQLPTKADLRFSNQGNIHVVPRGNLTVTDIFGRLVAQGTVNENSLYVFPDTQRVVSQKINRVAVAIPGVPLKVRITGHSQPGDMTFSWLSWVLYIPPVLPVMVVGSGVLITYSWYHRHQHASPST